jgi:hypothetical protein
MAPQLLFQFPFQFMLLIPLVLQLLQIPMVPQFQSQLLLIKLPLNPMDLPSQPPIPMMLFQ